jgi:hypothetical protein
MTISAVRIAAILRKVRDDNGKRPAAARPLCQNAAVAGAVAARRATSAAPCHRCAGDAERAEPIVLAR